jgi:hypothetical protein
MPASKKKTSRKKKSTQPSATPKIEQKIETVAELCARHIDPNTIALSDNPKFKKWNPEAAESLPKGTKRVDANTIVTV